MEKEIKAVSVKAIQLTHYYTLTWALNSALFDTLGLHNSFYIMEKNMPTFKGIKTVSRH